MVIMGKYAHMYECDGYVLHLVKYSGKHFNTAVWVSYETFRKFGYLSLGCLVLYVKYCAALLGVY